MSAHLIERAQQMEQTLTTVSSQLNDHLPRAWAGSRRRPAGCAKRPNSWRRSSRAYRGLGGNDVPRGSMKPKRASSASANRLAQSWRCSTKASPVPNGQLRARWAKRRCRPRMRRQDGGRYRRRNSIEARRCGPRNGKSRPPRRPGRRFRRSFLDSVLALSEAGARRSPKRVGDTVETADGGIVGAGAAHAGYGARRSGRLARQMLVLEAKPPRSSSRRIEEGTAEREEKQKAQNFSRRVALLIEFTQLAPAIDVRPRSCPMKSPIAPGPPT